MQTVVCTSLTSNLPNELVRVVESYLCLDIVAARRVGIAMWEEVKIRTSDSKLLRLQFRASGKEDKLNFGIFLTQHHGFRDYVGITISAFTGGFLAYFDDAKALEILLRDGWLLQNLERYPNLVISCDAWNDYNEYIMRVYAKHIKEICKAFVEKLISLCPYH